MIQVEMYEYEPNGAWWVRIIKGERIVEFSCENEDDASEVVAVLEDKVIDVLFFK